jgi:hypothetical protein
MNRLAKILAAALVIGLLAAPSAFGKSLQPPLPADARGTPSAHSSPEPSDTAAITAASGFVVLLVGFGLYPLSRAVRLRSTPQTHRA